MVAGVGLNKFELVADMDGPLREAADDDSSAELARLVGQFDFKPERQLTSRRHVAERISEAGGLPEAHQYVDESAHLAGLTRTTN